MNEGNFFCVGPRKKKLKQNTKNKKVISIDPRNGNPGVNPIKQMYSLRNTK